LRSGEPRESRRRRRRSTPAAPGSRADRRAECACGIRHE